MQLSCIGAQSCLRRMWATPLTLANAHLDGARRSFRVVVDRAARHALVTSSQSWLPYVVHCARCRVNHSQSKFGCIGATRPVLEHADRLAFHWPLAARPRGNTSVHARSGGVCSFRTFAVHGKPLLSKPLDMPVREYPGDNRQNRSTCSAEAP